MATYTDKHLKAIENFEILPPRPTGSTDDTITVPKDMWERVPFELAFPGIPKDIPDVSYVRVHVTVGNVSNIHPLTAQEALNPQTLHSDVSTFAFGDREPKTLKVYATVYVFLNENETISARSADRDCHVKFE